MGCLYSGNFASRPQLRIVFKETPRYSAASLTCRNVSFGGICGSYRRRRCGALGLQTLPNLPRNASARGHICKMGTLDGDPFHDVPRHPSLSAVVEPRGSRVRMAREELHVLQWHSLAEQIG